MLPATPIALLNEVFGFWNSHEWESAQLTDDQVDLAQLESVIMAVPKLSDRHKRVIQLRYFHQFSFREIGRDLGVTQNRAREMDGKARRHLRCPFNLHRLERAVPGWFNIHRQIGN